MSKKEKGLIQQPHHKWQDRLEQQEIPSHYNVESPAQMHKSGDEFGSVEVRFLPYVRRLAHSLAAAKGMGVAECIEALVVDAINNNPDLIKQGEERLEKHGSLKRVRRSAVEEELTSLRAAVAAQKSTQTQR